jgi:hypothetical protein
MAHGKIKFLNRTVENISWIWYVRTLVLNMGHNLTFSCRYGMHKLPRILGSHKNKELVFILWKSELSQTLIPCTGIRKSPSSNLRGETVPAGFTWYSSVIPCICETHAFCVGKCYRVSLRELHERMTKYDKTWHGDIWLEKPNWITLNPTMFSSRGVVSRTSYWAIVFQKKKKMSSMVWRFS